MLLLKNKKNELALKASSSIEKNNMQLLRKPETEKIYQEYLRTKKKDDCFFCKNAPSVTDHIQKRTTKWEEEYKYFFLIENEYPYDNIYSTHYLLATKRHTMSLRPEEKLELEQLFKKHISNFDQIVFNSVKRQTVKNHFHVHFVIFREIEPIS